MKLDFEGTFNEIELKEISEFVFTFKADDFEEKIIDKDTYEIYLIENNGVIVRITFTHY